MSESDARSWMSCIGWGCLVVAALAVLGIGACVAVVYRGGSAAHDVTKDYLQAVEEGRFEDAFDRLGPELSADRELAGFVEFERANRAAFGGCGAWRLEGTSVNREAGRSTAALSYRAECAAGPVAVSFAVERIGDRWLIQDIRYRETERPLSSAGCAECGTALPAGSRFCPSCGAAVAAADGPESPVRTPTGGAE